MGNTKLYASIKAVLANIFPPQCQHCRTVHEKLGIPLCDTCISHLEILQPPLKGDLLITFEGIGPAQSLVRGLKRDPTLKTSAVLAAYMAIQYSRTNFPLPDFVTAVPSTRFRRWQVGGDIAAMLAKELGKILARPFLKLLLRKRQLLRQDLLPKEERFYLSSDDFQQATQQTLRGKTILLVDDTITTGTTLRCCSEPLWRASADRVIQMACLDQGYLETRNCRGNL